MFYSTVMLGIFKVSASNHFQCESFINLSSLLCCVVNNVVVWYKNETVIATGQHAISANVEGTKNNSIILKNVNSDDQADYFCVVMPQKIKMRATLKVGGRLIITLDGRDVTGRAVTLKQGGLHTLECTTYLSNDARIRWSLNVSASSFLLF